jgi:hypothetical protein
MGINDEYSRDAYQFEQVYEDSDDQEELETETHPELWESMYSEEIFDGWTILQEYIHANYLTLKNNCTFTKFCELVIQPSRYSQSHAQSSFAMRAWDDVKRVRIVSERVDPENFYTWFQTYVDLYK